jgi:transcriptional regulator with XRE-family HTH domain
MPGGAGDKAWQMRRELGRRLRKARQAARMRQADLARRSGYARSTIGVVESAAGRPAGRRFWAQCDQIFGPQHHFAASWDQIQQLTRAGRDRARPRTAAPSKPDRRAQLRALRVLPPGREADAAAIYAQLGWPVTRDGTALELETGTVADALEVPRPAGVLAAAWWLDSRGTVDDIRGLPALPHPDKALAVIAAGSSYYFLAQAGACPWIGTGPPAAEVPGVQRPAVVGWHSGGSRVPLPPGRDHDGSRAGWAYLPSRAIGLASPVAVLDLLAKAVAALRDDSTLTLPGGVLAMPRYRPHRP